MSVTSISSSRLIPELSLAVSVTGSEPLRAPPASRPEASTVALGTVGSLIVMSEPMHEVLDPAAGGDRARVGAVVAAEPQRERVRGPGVGVSAGKLRAVDGRAGDVKLFSG